MADRVYGRNFGRVPDELLWDRSVSDAACRLYAALTRYSQQRERVVPPRQELANRLGWSMRTFARHLAELAKVAAVYVEEQHGPGGAQVASRYWLDGLRPPGVAPVSDLAPGTLDPRAKSDTPGGDKNGTPKRRESTSPNGDGGKATDGRSDTIVGKAIDALGFSPVERGAFAKILTEAEKNGVAEEIILKAVRHWGDGAEPVSWLTGHIGQLDREHRARAKRASNGHGGAAQVRHDGKHDPSCWCYDVPEEQRAKVNRGDLLRAAGLAPQTPEEVTTQIEAEDAQARAEGRCCASHSSTCEPPSELCCFDCSEARHPDHPDGVPCVLGVTGE